MDLPVLRALHPGHTGMKAGLKVAAIEVTPESSLLMVEEESTLATFRTGPVRSVRMGHPNVDAAIGNTHLHAIDRPRLYDTRDVAAEVDVLQHRLPPQGTHRGDLKLPPTKPGEQIYETGNAETIGLAAVAMVCRSLPFPASFSPQRWPIL